MSAWQLIETAPKDGTELIGATQAKWVRAFPHFPYPLKVHWSGGRWIANDGRSYDPQPTHWMPYEPKGENQ